MNATPARGQVLPLVAIALAAVAIVAIIVSGVLGGSKAPAPTNPPSAQPSAQPTVPPTAEPSDVPGDGTIRIALDNVTGKHVRAVIDDQSGNLVDAVSGNTGDGMSVRWFEVEVENIDAETLRVTWVALPQDGEVQVLVAKGEDGRYHLLIVQPAPPANSDALGHDLVLVLEFDEAVDAADVGTEVREDVDTGA